MKALYSPRRGKVGKGERGKGGNWERGSGKGEVGSGKREFPGSWEGCYKFLRRDKKSFRFGQYTEPLDANGYDARI